jgi:hypothetical protein
MVMRNRHDGTNTPEWWDDLPPSLRKRFTQPAIVESQPGIPLEREPRLYRPGVMRDLSRLAVMFFAVAIANLIFLLVALSFLSGTGPLGR